MVLSKLQMKIILDNPKATNEELAKMANCSERTIQRHRKIIRENFEKKTKGEEPTKEATKGATKGCQSIARAPDEKPRDIVALYKDVKDLPFVAMPEDIFKVGTEYLVRAFSQYRDAVSKLEADPEDVKKQWYLKQREETLNKVLIILGKWHGLEKESVVNNTVNIGNTVNVVSEEEVAKLEQFIRENDPNAL